MAWHGSARQEGKARQGKARQAKARQGKELAWQGVWGGAGVGSDILFPQMSTKCIHRLSTTPETAEHLKKLLAMQTLVGVSVACTEEIGTVVGTQKGCSGDSCLLLQVDGVNIDWLVTRWTRFLLVPSLLTFS